MKTEKILDFIDPNLLESNAVKFNDEVVRYFNDKQILNIKSTLVERIFESDKKKAFATYVKGLMDADLDPETIAERINEATKDLPETESGLKSLQKEIDKLKLKIKDRFESNEEQVYKFAYYDLNKIAIYDVNGYLLSSRPMHAHEKQTDIFYLNTASNE